MLWRLAADVVLLAHVAFVAFVVLGGFLVLRRPKVAWAHVPAAIWGILIEFAGFVCPLTPLEVALRRRAGQPGYEGGFLEHYLIPLLYPEGLTRGLQIALGTAVLALNAVIYARLLARGRARPGGDGAKTAG